MSAHIVKVLTQFYSHGRQSDSMSALLNILSSDISYDLHLSQPDPQSCSFQGREMVSDYLIMLSKTYQILESNSTVVIPNGNRIIAHGGEHARLLLRNQIVKTEWLGIFELDGEMIKHIAMSIYRWKILSISGMAVAAPSRQIAVRAQA